MTLGDLLTAAREELGRQRYAEAVALLAPYAASPAIKSNVLQRYYGEALCRAGRPHEGIEALMKALALKVDDSDAHLQLGFALQTLQMPAEAAECFRTVAALRPDSVMAQAYLAIGDQKCANWQHFDANLAALLAAVRAKPDSAADEFCVPFALVGLPHEPADLLKAAQVSSRFLARGCQPLPRVAARPKERLRIGYLSGDFHAHATAALLVEVLESRDRERFEVLLFSHGVDDGSALGRRVRQACEKFIDVSDQDLAGIARRVRAEGVDILVDLKGHTADSHMAALAFRPAPVQVAWLGFPGTCGADYVDYIIGDPVVTPLADAAAYSERIAQMPGCYQPSDAQRLQTRVPGRAELGLPEDAFVLLSANQVYKITPTVFDAWMEILRRAPNAVLWQLSGGEPADTQLKAQAQRRGIAPERVVIAPKVDMDAHWRRLAAADLALDTWPCNGHTTTRDVLGAGVPVLTLKCDGFPGRVAASILQAAGLQEWVTEDVDAYVERAVEACQQPPARIDAERSYDSTRFARELEALYLRMWERAAAGLPPAALPAQVTA